jgi:hypothetical protein
MDEDFYRSLKFKFDFEKGDIAKQKYVLKIGDEKRVYALHPSDWTEFSTF